MKKNRARERISALLWFLALAVMLPMILAPPLSHAWELSEEEVKSAVQTWVRHVTADARPDAVIEKMEPYIVNGKTVAYIAHLKDGGYCLCGQNEVVLPVYLYNPEGTYDKENPGTQCILYEIATRNEVLTLGIKGQTEEASQLEEVLMERNILWQTLIAGQIPSSIEGGEDAEAAPSSMELNLTSKWHQDSPYNDQCPVLTPSSDEHCVVGCNATAASQVMYYWKWPTQGYSSAPITYEFRFRTSWDSESLSFNPGIPGSWAGGNRLRWQTLFGGNYLQMNGYWDWSLLNGAKTDDSITNHANPTYQTAVDNLYNRLTQSSKTSTVYFGSTTYNWNIIKDVHPDTTAGDAEVAKLCYHVSAASESTYGFWGTASCFGCSDSTHRDIKKALDIYFRYDNDITFYPERNPSTVTYMADEIQWLRPVLLGGSNADGGGHAYVVYGYNKGPDPDQFLMNMGWGPGNDHVWYSLDSTPFPLNQDHLIRIAPESGVKFVGSSVSGDGSPSSPYQNIEQAIALAASNTRLIFKAGSFNSYSPSSLVINRAFTLSGHNAVIGK